MKIKDYSGVEHDIFDACVEADRDGRGRTYFYVMGRKHGDYGSVKTCCIHVFRGVEGLETSLDLLQELRAGLRKEKEAGEKAREMQP